MTTEQAYRSSLNFVNTGATEQRAFELFVHLRARLIDSNESVDYGDNHKARAKIAAEAFESVKAFNIVSKEYL